MIRGLDSDWSPAEKEKLFILDIKPDKLIRVFDLLDTKQVLQLYFDSQYNLLSNLISKVDMDEIIKIWTRKAFIDDEMDTRTPFGEFHLGGNSTGACKFIENILKTYYPNGTVSTSGGSPSGGGSPTGGDSTTGGVSTTGGGPRLLNFFGGLNWSSVRETEHNGKGVIAVCKELMKISSNLSFINSYPICTAFIIRALIEQSLKFYAKRKGFWATIMQSYYSLGRSSGDPQLSFIIKQYEQNIKAWIPDQNIRRIFNVVFNQNVQVEKFNLVVHSPECYTLSPDTLKSIPDEGLLTIANYLLT